jgi:hypothetical protein
LDLSGFNPKAPPPKTAAFWEIVDASRAPEDGELADVLDKLNSPRDRHGSTTHQSGTVLHRLEDCGYVAVRNNGAKSGLWVVDGKRQVTTPRPICRSGNGTASPRQGPAMQ